MSACCNFFNGVFFHYQYCKYTVAPCMGNAFWLDACRHIGGEDLIMSQTVLLLYYLNSVYDCCVSFRTGYLLHDFVICPKVESSLSIRSIRRSDSSCSFFIIFFILLFVLRFVNN